MQRFSFPIGPFSMAVAIGGGLLLVPERAAAQSSDGVTGGITLSYSKGVRPAFGIGLDLRYSHYSPTSEDPRLGVDPFLVYNYAVTGAFVQAAYLQGGAFRFALHTRLCAALASEYTGFDVTALMLGIPKQRVTNREDLLKKLALESFWDGCIGEAAAAAQARRMATRTADKRTRETFSIIAHDEQTHADLAADIVRFCLADGGKPIRNALVSSIEAQRLSYDNEPFSAHETYANADEDKLRSFGHVDMLTQRLAQEEALATSLHRTSLR